MRKMKIMNAQPISSALGRIACFTLSFGLLAVLPACGSGGLPGGSVETGWYHGQEFHIESRYRNLARHSEPDVENLDPSVGAVGPTVDALVDELSEPAYWRYQVIEQGLRPQPGEDFFQYAVMGGKKSPLTVIKASLDAEMNIGHELVDADPKIYMVFREDRMRMAGMVSFHTAGSERVSQAITVDPEQMNRSFSVLSQSSLSVVPHFVPPFPIRTENADLRLEDGQRVTFANASEGRVDVIYENALDNTLIAETWEDGLPWAKRSITPSSESRMLSRGEVHEIKGGLAGTMSETIDEEDFDYVALLRQPINLSSALGVDELLGRHSFEVRESHRPWAGSWWRQSEGALIFGYRNDYSGGNGAFPDLSSAMDTFSDIGRERFEEPAKELQKLAEELRTLRKAGSGDSEEYREMVADYRETQSGLVEVINTFYGAIQQGLNGGQITIDGDAISAEENWNDDSEDPYPAFHLDINSLSPLDKFALLQQVDGRGWGNNPWMGPGWEILNHWSPVGSSWWGHCNGWAAAAILTEQPTEEVLVDFGGEDEYQMSLSAADQKGLLTESHYSTLSSFYGARYNGDEDEDISDLSPKSVLQLLNTYIGQRGVPIVFDTSPGAEVWNYPAWAYELTLTETAGPLAEAAAGLVNVNLAGFDELQQLWGVGDLRAQAIIDYRETYGPFQEKRDIMDVYGVGYGLFRRLQDDITVTQADALREFDGGLRVRFATDGVGYTHIDSDPSQPEGFWKTWNFTISANSAGEIIDGTWDSPQSGHPDFAWVPYANTERSGNSENPYLRWTDLESYLPGVTRE